MFEGEVQKYMCVWWSGDGEKSNLYKVGWKNVIYERVQGGDKKG